MPRHSTHCHLEHQNPCKYVTSSTGASAEIDSRFAQRLDLFGIRRGAAQQRPDDAWHRPYNYRIARSIYSPLIYGSRFCGGGSIEHFELQARGVPLHPGVFHCGTGACKLCIEVFAAP